MLSPSLDSTVRACPRLWTAAQPLSTRRFRYYRTSVFDVASSVDIRMTASYARSITCITFPACRSTVEDSPWLRLRTVVSTSPLSLSSLVSIDPLRLSNVVPSTLLASRRRVPDPRLKLPVSAKRSSTDGLS